MSLIHFQIQIQSNYTKLFIVLSAVIAVTNELSEVTKQAFTYDSPFEEMGNKYILVKSVNI